MRPLLTLCMPIAACLLLTACGQSSSTPSYSRSNELALNDSGYFETRGLNYFVFSNNYDALFDDSKVSAVELIQHGLRTATNGDVRLNPTPGQWDKLPRFVSRHVDQAAKRIDVKLEYPQYAFAYTLSGEARDGGFYLSVSTDKALPDSLVGIAGLNLEFFPPVFFEHAYLMDGKPGLFPTSAADNMAVINGIYEPTPMATGTTIEIAPDAPRKHVTIRTTLEGSQLMLFDGRDKQQNGTFVVRTLLPAKQTGKIAEWFLQAETEDNWIRTPNISYSQVGYHPEQQKMAVVELDQNDRPLSGITLYKVNADGSLTAALSGKPTDWGRYTRYNYLQFDFSSVREPGIYKLKYGDQLTGPFPIDANVYQRAWYPTLDVFMPVQMDHMFVREAYRVWHGAAHLDDARQAPLNRSHWDGWRQGPTTGNKYKPGQHIPGLNVGGWFDAGDFDIQTPSQQSTVQSLVDVWDEFAPARDETTINQQTRYTEIHLPDGKPDVLQQIEHGSLQLIAQVNAFGYTIPGINESHLYQYRHLGDAVTKTDGISGNEDDRWAFTDRSVYLNYNSAVSLAAAARVLPVINPAVAREALRVAEFIWKDEHNRNNAEEGGGTFFARGGNATAIECRTAYELWRTTDKAEYKKRMDELVPELLKQPAANLTFLLRLVPYMDNDFKEKLKPAVQQYIDRQIAVEAKNPYGISIALSSWAGNGQIISTGVTNYRIHKVFPDMVNPELIYRGLNYLYGCHPYHNLSFVSGVGAQPKKIAYGNNRADHAFIPGGIVPGVRLLRPDFPENRDDYQFHWSENEYVIPLAPNYIYLVNAVEKLLGGNR
ncbi:MAG: glycoside hydrolase family 9 protein [Prevotellaceae bacterium]|nr:glycoside hydrolase family 9 protein [Prevotellaceae bacterium]